MRSRWRSRASAAGGCPPRPKPSDESACRARESGTSSSAVASISANAASSAATCSADARSAAISAIAGSMTRLNSKSSRTRRSLGAASSCQARRSASSAFQPSGSRTLVPVRGRASTSPLLASTRTASRSTVRLTPSCADQIVSLGSAAPGWSRAATISMPSISTVRPTRPRIGTPRTGGIAAEGLASVMLRRSGLEYSYDRRIEPPSARPVKTALKAAPTAERR